MSNTTDFKVKNGLSVGTSITAIGSLTTAGQTFPAADGSAGQYLKTDGSGALSWGTVSTSLNITDGTTTDTVGLTETVTFTGGTNITLAVTDNTITINNDHVNSSDITENTNLFFTDARAIAAVQGAADLTIDGGTIYVDTSANRVGISDTSPQQTLDVAGNIGVNGTEVINTSSQIVGAVLDSALTVGGSLAGVLSNLKIQYGTSYSGTPIQGSFFFDSLNQKLKVYTGSAFVDAVPAGGGGGGGGGASDANTTFRNYSYTLTGTTSAVTGVDDNEIDAGAFIIGHKYTITSVGNTSFTGIGASGNTVGVVFTATGVGTGTGKAKQTLFYDTTSASTRVVAYVNGIKQVYGSGRDFVATTGTSVAFTYNLGSGDTVDIQVYELLTNDAYYLKSEVYTQTQVNSQISTGVSSYLPLTGGVLTNDLAINNGSPELYFGTTGNHYNWRIAAQEAVDAAFEISVGSQDTDYSNDTYTPKLVVKANGNVGIGESTPLDSLSISSATGDAAIRLKRTDTAIVNDDIYGVINFAGDDSDSNASGIRGFIRGRAQGTGGGMKMEFHTAGGGAALVSDPRMTLNADGQLGIGTTGPAALLHVNGSGDAVRVTSTNTGSGGAQVDLLHFTSSPADNDIHAMINMGGYTSGTSSAYGSSIRSVWTDVSAKEAKLEFLTRDDSDFAARMTIDKDGNVGIGTTSPPATLSVYGNEATGMGISIHDDGWGGANGLYMMTVLNSNGAFVVRKNTANALDFSTSQNQLEVGTDGVRAIGYGNSATGDNVSVEYTGTAGGHKSGYLFRDKRDVVNAAVKNYLLDDGVGTAAANLELYTSDSGTLTKQMNIDRYGYIDTTNPRFSVGSGTYNARTGKTGVRVGRTVYNWFNYGVNASGNYLHIKTNLANIVGSNPQATMSSFHIRGYTYGGESIDSILGFHNWSGIYYNPVYTNNGSRTVVSASYAPYRSSDNKVVIVLNLGTTYPGISIDYMQNFEYTWYDVEVSAYSKSASTSGVY